MDNIFNALNNANVAARAAAELNGRNLYLELAVVTSNRDPTGNRRIKVTLASKPGLESDWVRRLQLSPSIDDPLPRVGQTVLVGAIQGNPHALICLGTVINSPNPALDKGDAALDSYQEIDGDVKTTIQGKSEIDIKQQSKTTTGDDFTIDCGRSIRLQNTAGAYLELNEAGFVVVGAASGQKWVLGGGADGAEWAWDANGAAIQIVNLADFTLNGQSAVTLGGLDSDGDTLVQRGY
ncbi:MAG: hypothetical protein KME10_17925 [Plectolyngbya sp. WJT66-NPBG17]|jgi:hypothetical protein|nr:hypothetical protein [Plectolyngbya sp. WJT66-NPBG17]MBW4525092.1 hypothetical protein [Phormidium tanganyikae FI6-MK23]